MQRRNFNYFEKKNTRKSILQSHLSLDKWDFIICRFSRLRAVWQRHTPQKHNLSVSTRHARMRQKPYPDNGHTVMNRLNFCADFLNKSVNRIPLFALIHRKKKIILLSLFLTLTGKDPELTSRAPLLLLKKVFSSKFSHLPWNEKSEKAIGVRFWYFIRRTTRIWWLT